MECVTHNSVYHSILMFQFLNNQVAQTLAILITSWALIIESAQYLGFAGSV